MLAPGMLVRDRYRLEALLGEGATARTFRAIDERDGGKALALKVLSLQQVADWSIVERFELEARMLRQLDHPAIPRYIDAFLDETQQPPAYVLVQELAEGLTLRRLVARDGPRPGAELERIAEQLLAICVYLHERTVPVVHRDIKPDNIVVDDEGTLRLVDFGGVRELWAGTQLSKVSTVGTFGYMAPEQLSGRSTPQSDLYAVGATLCFSATGREPADLPQRRLRIDWREAARLDGALGRLLDRLLEPMAEDRIASAEQALRVLRGDAMVALSRPAGSRAQIEPSGDGLRVLIPALGIDSRAWGQIALASLLFGSWLVFVFLMRAGVYRAPMLFLALISLIALPLLGQRILSRAFGAAQLETTPERLRYATFWRGQRTRLVEASWDEVQVDRETLVIAGREIDFSRLLSDEEAAWVRSLIAENAPSRPASG